MKQTAETTMRWDEEHGTWLCPECDEPLGRIYVSEGGIRKFGHYEANTWGPIEGEADYRCPECDFRFSFEQLEAMNMFGGSGPKARFERWIDTGVIADAVAETIEDLTGEPASFEKMRDLWLRILENSTDWVLTATMGLGTDGE